jgi:hypothetical protein
MRKFWLVAATICGLWACDTGGGGAGAASKADAALPPENTEAQCADALDNDADGKSDCEDEGCGDFDFCQPDGGPIGGAGGGITPSGDAGPTGGDATPGTDDRGLLVIPDASEVLQPFGLNSIVPNRGVTAGGTEVRIIGTGFTPEVKFLFANADECQNVVVENQNRATCTTPPGMVGPVDVLAQQPSTDPFARPDSVDQVQLAGAFSYFETVSLSTVTPNRIPLRGGIQLTLRGTGLVEGTRVHVGATEADEPEYIAPDELRVFAPIGTPGFADVSVMNFNGSDTVARAVFYYEDLELNGVEPAAGPLAGGNAVDLVGHGLVAETQVTFGGAAAAVVSASDDRTRLTVTVPGAAAVGPVDVSATNDNGTADLPGGYVYFDPAAGGLTVAGIAPASGPVEGGNVVFVAGSGFGAETVVEVAGRAIDCERLDANVLQCTMPPGDLGPVDVSVRSGGDTVELPGAYTYYASLEILAVRPEEGAIAGNTFVAITGRGFVDGMNVDFGGIPLVDVRVVDDGRIEARTPPNTAGPVDVHASTAFARATLPSGYTYFDPISRFGGVWGDPIRGAVNVTCIHAMTGMFLEEVAVMAISEENDTRVEGLTNAQGQVVLSEEGLRGPLNITAAKEGFEVTTVEDVDVQNVTIYLTPNTSEMGPPPPGVLPATLRGTVTGLDLLPKPDRESVVNVIVIETTHSSPYNRSQLPPPGPGGLLFEDGPFEIIARPGELAIVATAGELDRAILTQYQNGELDYWTMRQSLVPAAMGLRRFISASPGIALDNLDVNIDHPMDLELPIDLDNPPAGGAGGPEYYAALVRLNLGAEGYWEIDTQAFDLQPALTMPRLPRLDGWDADLTYFFFGLALSATDTQTPMSITIEETRDVEGGVLITPFVGAPHPIDPLDGAELNADRIVDWEVYDGFDGPITAPHGNLVAIEEPGFPANKPMWRYVTPGMITQYQIPELPEAAGSAGLSAGPMYLTVIPFYVQGQFDFGEFTYDELSQFRWKAWAVHTTVFLP